ncbi:carbohydrate-selective porin, OprB family [mine drainage metagenome]|uniref:Carbohydrate-selective porin, OprB family n=1 Tax=mine drainage metagenome TaxID=410659 RepID=A0A1J5PT35_9ZZZZ
MLRHYSVRPSLFLLLSPVLLWVPPVAAQTPDPTATTLQLAPFAAPVTPPAQAWQNGLSTSLHLDTETLAVVGGPGSRQMVSVAAFQAALTLDTRQAGLWHGGQFDLMTMGLRSGGNLQAVTGDVQLPSNLWAPNFLRIYQLSYRQVLGPGFVQGGIMDVNNTFDVTGVAGHLHNASFGIAPTLTANADIATFPNPGLGLLAGSDLGQGWRVQAGLWQGDPPGLTGALHRGALALAEVDRSWNDAEARRTTIKLGAWHLHQDHLADGPDSGGVYAVGEWSWRDARRRDWGAFLQGGYSPARSNTVSAYVGAGVRLRGLNPDRPADVLTVGVAQARPRGLPAETVLEAVYSLQIAPHVYLQPDIQRIDHPGGGAGRQWLAGLRMHIEH